jgi:hypothetical protein
VATSHRLSVQRPNCMRTSPKREGTAGSSVTQAVPPPNARRVRSRVSATRTGDSSSAAATLSPHAGTSSATPKSGNKLRRLAERQAWSCTGYGAAILSREVTARGT